MFARVRRLLGAIRVREVNNLIMIDGLDPTLIMDNIRRIWATSKIEAFMFTKIGNSSVSFNKFFALDIVYTLETIYKERKGRHNYRAIEQIIELMYEHTWIKQTLEEHDDILDFSKLSEMNVTLLPHQDDFLQLYNENVPRYNLRGYILAAVPGSGKTILGLALGSCLKADVVICIVPKNSVDEVWGNTLATRYTKPVKFWTSKMPGEPPLDCRYYVFHYEQLERAIEFAAKLKSRVKPLVILDESHNLNELTSQRTLAFIELCKAMKARHVVYASGTPVKAIGNEVIPILMTLCEDFDADAALRFKGIYGKSSSRAVDILKNRLGYMTFKVDKAVVVANKVTTTEIKVQMPHGEKYSLDSIREDMRKFIEERMKYYQDNMKGFINFYEECLKKHALLLKSPQQKKDFETYKTFIREIRKGYDPVTMKDLVMFCNAYELKQIIPYLPKELRDGFKGARSVVKYYALKVQGEALGRILGKQRSQCHVDMVPYCNLEELVDNGIKKTVIFTSYVEVVKSTHLYLEGKGYSPTVVYGETNKDLTGIIEQFRTDIDVNPLIATFQSLSTAVPLIMANQVILMNSPFRAHEYQQATARVDRLGQDTPVMIYNIFLDTGALPNISTRSGDIMQWSKDQVDAILGTSSSNLDLAIEAFQLLVPDVSPVELSFESYKPAWARW